METKEEFWALKDVNFTVERGEAIGIIGANGAGKSTLLKILSKITPPTTGTIEYKGRMSSLLEVGTGFHPELTGRENIFLNGAILGMTKKEIAKKFNDIVKFAEIEKFIDTPVKRYSSGMYVRLAFAVAAHMEPDILVVDEVLAVGDAEFQKKCLGKMDEVTKTAGRTILFVSHNMAAIQNLCKRCILLEQGQVKMIGETKEVIGEYLKLSRNDLKEHGPYKTKNDNVIINYIKLKNTPNNPLKCNDPLQFDVLIDNKHPIANIQMGVQILNSQLSRIMTAKIDIPRIEAGKNKISIIVNNPHLPPGNYSVNFGIENLFYKTQIIYFEISTINVEDEFAASRQDILGVYPPTCYTLNDSDQ